MATMIAKPDLPSSVVRWIGQDSPRVEPTTNETVAIIGTADWGPMGSDSESMPTGASGISLAAGGETYPSLAEYEGVYGLGDSPLRDAVLQAFVGMNVPGGRGAGGVIPYRIAGAGVAAATLVRQNTTPTNAITFDALYKGTFGNRISIVIEDDPADASKDRVRVLVDGATKESYSYAQTDITSLVAQINTRPSRYIKATQQATGTALSPTTGTSLAGGNDGAAPTVTEYSTALTGLEFKNFAWLAAANLTDVPTKVTIATWVKQQADEMRPLRVVFGGAAGEATSAVVTELGTNAALRDEHVIRFGVGTIHDDVANKDFSTAQLAAWLAGVGAARGLKSSLTRALAGGKRYVGSTGPNTTDLKTGRDAGITMLRRVSHPEAELAVSQGVTTFISTTTAGKPYKFFSDPRIVGLLDNTVRRMTQWGDDVVIGDLTVTDQTRDEVRKEMLKILGEYEAEGLAQPGTSFVNVDPPDDPTLDDAVPYVFGFKPARTANYLIGEGRIS